MDLFIIILFTISLLFFAIDYLSNKYITHSETKIGLLILLHHLLYNTMKLMPLLLFMKVSLPFLIFITSGILFAQILWIKFHDHCPFTEYINKLIDPSTKEYKWRATPEDFLKHYIRGDSWGYSNITNFSKNKYIILANILLIIIFIKWYYESKTKTS